MLAFPMDSKNISSWFSFDYASAVSLTPHFIHSQFSHLQISLHLFTSYRNPPMGPPPSTSSPHNLRPHRPSHMTSGHPFLYLHTYPKLFLIHLVIIQSLFISIIYLILVVTFSDLPFPAMQPLSPLVGAFCYLLLSSTSSINPEYPTVHTPLISEFVHFVTHLAQFKPTSSSPPDARSRFMVAATHTLHISSTKSSLESHHISTSSMFLISS
jgi:hypothetical protein